MTAPRRVIGVDPGSVRMGIGIVEQSGTRLARVASWTVSCGTGAFPERLARIYEEIARACREFAATEAAIEALFHHRNAQSALKLGHARGVAMLGLGHAGLSIAEYEPRLVKKTVTGSGAAEKEQVRSMVGVLLGWREAAGTDESDALAIAICHLFHDSRLHTVLTSSARSRTALPLPRRPA